MCSAVPHSYLTVENNLKTLNIPDRGQGGGGRGGVGGGVEKKENGTNKQSELMRERMMVRQKQKEE